jgi:hypothetical protein
MSKFLTLFVFAGGLAHAQFGFGFGIGVKGGYPFTDVMTTQSVAGLPTPSLSTSSNYMVGPVAELRLPLGFAVEVDGLYRSAEFQQTLAGIPVTAVKANSWEVPYLAKWRFPIPVLKPFLVAGGSYRTFTSLPGNTGSSNHGYGGGAGLELRIARLRLSGEVRYFRWEAPEVTAIPSPFTLSRNQGQVLFGLMF